MNYRSNQEMNSIYYQIMAKKTGTRRGKMFGGRVGMRKVKPGQDECGSVRDTGGSYQCMWKSETLTTQPFKKGGPKKKGKRQCQTDTTGARPACFSPEHERAKRAIEARKWKEQGIKLDLGRHTGYISNLGGGRRNSKKRGQRRRRKSRRL